MTTATTKRPRKEKESTIKFKVANTEIIIGNTYEIVGKRDLDAPSGFIEHNTKKLLIKGIEEVRAVPYDEDTRRWDTGFEINSSCNYNVPRESKQAVIDLYVKHIQKPYEAYYGVDTSATNADFWLEYRYSIGTGKKFDTTKEDQLFDLFHALKQGKVCEVGERDAILQRSANYCVRSQDHMVSLQEERANEKAEAIYTFRTLLDGTDPNKDDTLYTILEWMLISNIRGADKETLKRTINKLFDNASTGYDSAHRFMEAYEMTRDESGKEKMELFSMLTKLNYKKKLEFKRQQYYLEDVLLGNHLKAAAETAKLKPEVKELVISAFERHCQN